MNKVVLGLYTGKTTSDSFTGNVLSITDTLREEGMYGGVIHEVSCRVDANRNRIIKKFMETGHDFLFIIDEDMRHPPRMPIVLASRDKPIITGLYFRRSFDGNYCPVAYKHVGEGPSSDHLGHGNAINYNYQPITPETAEFLKAVQAPYINNPLEVQAEHGKPLPVDFSPSPLVPIDSSGFGCIMIRRDAVDKIQPPWLIDEPGLHGDLVFGKKARSLGIEYWADLSVIASHRHEDWVGVASFCDYTWKIAQKMEEERGEGSCTPDQNTLSSPAGNPINGEGARWYY